MELPRVTHMLEGGKTSSPCVCEIVGKSPVRTAYGGKRKT